MIHLFLNENIDFLYHCLLQVTLCGVDTSFSILSDLIGTIDILNEESLIDVELADSEVPPRKQGKLCLD
jgi:hypothetical protein